MFANYNYDLTDHVYNYHSLFFVEMSYPYCVESLEVYQARGSLLRVVRLVLLVWVSGLDGVVHFWGGREVYADLDSVAGLCLLGW